MLWHANPLRAGRRWARATSLIVGDTIIARGGSRTVVMLCCCRWSIVVCCREYGASPCLSPIGFISRVINWYRNGNKFPREAMGNTRRRVHVGASSFTVKREQPQPLRLPRNYQLSPHEVSVPILAASLVRALDGRAQHVRDLYLGSPSYYSISLG